MRKSSSPTPLQRQQLLGQKIILLDHPGVHLQLAESGLQRKQLSVPIIFLNHLSLHCHFMIAGANTPVKDIVFHRQQCVPSQLITIKKDFPSPK